jgi:hypothetical protein
VTIDVTHIRILTRLEEDLWRHSTRTDLNLMNKVLADDFVEFGRSGRVWHRAEMFTSVPPFEAVLPLPNLAIRGINDTTALVTYDSIVTSQGETKYARRSSLWSHQSGHWILHFHQGTPYDPSAWRKE